MLVKSFLVTMKLWYRSPNSTHSTNEATTVMAGPKYKMYNQVLPWKNSIPMHFHENIYLKLIFVKCLEYNFKRERNLFPK